jgi:hypothetical protein
MHLDVVGPRDLPRRRRRRTICASYIRRPHAHVLPKGWIVGRAIFPHSRSGRTRTQLRAADLTREAFAGSAGILAEWLQDRRSASRKLPPALSSPVRPPSRSFSAQGILPGQDAIRKDLENRFKAKFHDISLEANDPSPAHINLRCNASSLMHRTKGVTGTVIAG